MESNVLIYFLIVALIASIFFLIKSNKLLIKEKRYHEKIK